MDSRKETEIRNLVVLHSAMEEDVMMEASITFAHVLVNFVGAAVEQQQLHRDIIRTMWRTKRSSLAAERAHKRVHEALMTNFRSRLLFSVDLEVFVKNFRMTPATFDYLLSVRIITYVC